MPGFQLQVITDQNSQCCHDTKSCHHLTHFQGTYHQRIRPISLNQETTHAITQNIDHGQLSVKLLSLPIPEQKDQDAKIPKSLQQERRNHGDALLVVDQFRVLQHGIVDHAGALQIIKGSVSLIIIDRDSHTEEGTSIASEHLAIEEVPPTSHDLTDQDTVGDIIRELRKIYFLLLCIDPGYKDTRYDPAIDRQTAVPDIDHPAERFSEADPLAHVFLQIKENVVNARA